MRRYLTRIIICVLPILISIAVVAWAVNEYREGRGGFRLGVDLAGGTILVYEVDESKMPDKFNADDLAAALKRRIDPADLYSIVIRPVKSAIPRVEIILPTGGPRQAEARKRQWEKILHEAAQAYPVEGQDDPYAAVEPGNAAALTDAIKAKHPKTSREEIAKWVEDKTRRGKGGRQMLTSDEVERIKRDIEKQGRLEFCILANSEDDPEAIEAAKAWIDDKKNKDELERLEVMDKPPPPPRNKEEGNSPLFPSRLPNEPPHSYRWVELGKSELHSLKLDSESLEKNKPLLDQVERAVKDQKTFMPGSMQSCLVYARRITDWTRRNIKDRQQGKKYEYFVLVRDPLADQRITGDDLAQVNGEQSTKEGGLSITFRLRPEGGNKFYEVSSKNKPTGPESNQFKRHLAIIFDNQIISAPVLNSAIRTNGEITGNFTQQEVDDLVRLMRAGALPATLKKNPVSENSMGATLGEDTIRKGTWSVLLAFVAVLAFMIFYYRFAGIVACVALLANLLLTVAFMVLVQAAFTLPGLAGLVLMLGMAVDANVLIYERLREERERGCSLAQALRNGYDRAFPTIIDTHLTSIFTAIVLYIVGNDQLKGFGISLTVGLIISLFTSLYMTRTLFEVWLAKNWLHDLRFGRLRFWLPYFGRVDVHHANIDFMRIRYYWFTATVVLTILGAGLFIYRLDRGALNIDFVGGTAYTAQLAEPMKLGELREKLETGSELPDLSIEPIYVGSDTVGEVRYFTVRTSQKDVNVVVQDVLDRIGKDLKRVNLGHWKIVSDREARLYFSDQQGKPDYASPGQVQMIVGKEFEQEFGPNRRFSIEKPKIDPSDADALARSRDDHYHELILKPAEPMDRALLEKVLKATQQEFASAPQPERLEIFDKQLAASTQERAMYAILASWMAILLYLWFRFGSWTFGAATVLCLIHDLFFTLGAIALCHYVYKTWFFGTILGIHDFKIDLPSVAALLTLVGYSVSDTIVVFDRIREVRGKNPLLTAKTINDSVNQTLSRTLLSSMTVWLVVIVLYIFGGEGVKLFAFVMVVGVIVGTYSSIYIASPLLLMFGEGSGTAADRAKAAQAAQAQAIATGR